jgi:uncharacterized protein RhaS with RHS repeats
LQQCRPFFYSVLSKAGCYDLHTAANTATTTIQSNASGLLQRITDMMGHSLRMTYDKGNHATRH